MRGVGGWRLPAGLLAGRFLAGASVAELVDGPLMHVMTKVGKLWRSVRRSLRPGVAVGGCGAGGRGGSGMDPAGLQRDMLALAEQGMKVSARQGGGADETRT